MNSRSTLIVSVIFLSVLFHACPSQSCLKKIRALIKNKGKEEKPAELAREDASYIKYAHGTTNNFYIEIRQNANRTFVVRDLDHPPIALSQVAGADFKGPTTTEAALKESDAEYVANNDSATNKDTNETMPIAATTEVPPPPPTKKPKVKDATGKEGEEEEEEELAPEDAIIRKEWGGKCIVKDWERCNKIRQIVVRDVINTPFRRESLELDCLLEPILCLQNGWTATRCHIICMAAQCNKQIFFNWDDTVDFEGPCRYRK